MRKIKLIIKKLALPILMYFLIFLFVEASCVYWVKQNNNALIRSSLVLWSDSQLAWRQRTNLDITFENTKVKTDEAGFRKASDKVNNLENSDILVLGPSSTFGWGVGYEDTFSSVLEKKLNLSVFNAGQIGFGVEQGIILWEQIRKKNIKFKFVVIGYGVNDVDRFRFFGANGLSDEDFFKLPEKQRLNMIEKVDVPLAFWWLSAHMIKDLSVLWPCPPTHIPQIRATAQKWIERMNYLAFEIYKTGAKPIILSSAFLFKNFTFGPEMLKESEEAYRRSAELARVGKCSEAREHFQLARKSEFYRIKTDLDKINDGIKVLSKTWKTVDLHNLLTEPEDYYDPVHPSVIGHKKIAEALIEMMRN